MTTLIATSPPFSPSRFFVRLDELLLRLFRDKRSRPRSPGHLPLRPSSECPQTFVWRSSIGR